jgi:hypothetical protein
MTNNIGQQRRYQPYEGGFGQAYTSPKKKRNYKKVKHLVQPIGFHRRRKELLDKLCDAQAKQTAKSAAQSDKKGQEEDSEAWESDDEPEAPGTSSTALADMEWEPNQCDDPGAEMLDPFGMDQGACSTDENPEPMAEKPSQPTTSQSTKSSALPSPSKTAQLSHHDRWTELLPSLVPHYLEYCEATIGKPIALPAKLEPRCNKNCSKKTYQILCLFSDRKFASPITADQNISILTQNTVDADTKAVNFCSCEGVVPVLIKNGLFPGSPSQPNIAISIALLDLYQALFERSCDAVNALASALVTHYRRRGFPVLNSSVCTAPLSDVYNVLTVYQGGERADGLRKTAAAAVSWYDHLGRLVDEKVAKAVEDAGKHLEDSTKGSHPNEAKAKQYLRQKCPACFAGRYGNSLSE